MKQKKEIQAFEFEKEDEKPNLKGDYHNLVILFLLYVLQGELRKTKVN